MVDNELIHKLRTAADIQVDKGELILADLLNQAALELRVQGSRIEQALAILRGDWL